MDLLTEKLRRDILNVWGEGDLDRVPLKQVPATGISTSTEIFLSEVGLPNCYSELIVFSSGDQLLRPTTLDGIDYYVFADEAGRPVGLKVDTDEVWSLDPSGRGRTRFVNSHPAFLVLFLGRMLPLISWQHGREPAEVSARMDEVAAEFEAYDSTAFASRDRWWPSVLEAAREGYL
ncbi:SUKH-4 family immunity protein [Nocardia gipuzkoensis]